MYQFNTLYRVERWGTQNSSGVVALHLKGSPLSVTVYGGEKPIEDAKDVVLADLAELAPDHSPFTSEGIETFYMIPTFLAITGTGDGFEASNIVLEKIKAL